MSESLFSDEIKFIMLGRFCQDVVENLFAKLRGSGGHNCTPSVREAMYFFRRNLNTKLARPSIISKYANCKPDVMEAEEQISKPVVIESRDDIEQQDIQVERPSTEQHIAGPEKEIEQKEAQNCEEFVEMDVEPHNPEPTSSKDLGINNNIYMDRHERPSTEHAAVSYYIGYIEMKCTNRSKCTSCIDGLTKAKQHCTAVDELITKKSYKPDKIGGLKLPSTTFYDICCLQICFFKSTFDKLYHTKNLKAAYVKKLMALTTLNYPDWFDEQNKCFEHRVQILNFLVLVLIRKNCKWLLEDISKSKSDVKYANKLKKIT